MAYKIKFDNFFSYSFSLDCILFGYFDQKIHVLTIKRAMEPFSGMWAIPGDLVYPDEDLHDAGNRILSELTNINNIELHQGQTFGKPNRHPLGRVITCVYFALVRIEDIEAKADSWAEEIKWVPVKELGSLAFDHNEIVTKTFEQLQIKLKNNAICFDLLSRNFTLNDFQQLYEYAFDVEFDKANFRKKIKNLPLVNLNVKQKNVKHRPANLYRFDHEKYKQMVEKENFNFKM